MMNGYRQSHINLRGRRPYWAPLVGCGLVTAAIIAVAAGYITHIVWAIDKASETGSAIALLIVGLIIPPVGILHGWCIWLGWGWI